jgi:hypothetical protein
VNSHSIQFSQDVLDGVNTNSMSLTALQVMTSSVWCAP